jgi:hypothetical protein
MGAPLHKNDTNWTLQRTFQPAQNLHIEKWGAASGLDWGTLPWNACIRNPGRLGLALWLPKLTLTLLGTNGQMRPDLAASLIMARCGRVPPGLLLFDNSLDAQPTARPLKTAKPAVQVWPFSVPSANT